MSAQRNRRRLLVFGKYLLYSGLLVGFSLFLFTAYVFSQFMFERAQIIETLQDWKQELSGRGPLLTKPPILIYARDGSVIGEFQPERGSRITLAAFEKMEWLPRAAVSAEDRNFYEHFGISLRGILRALYNNVRAFALREGGGSITQQLARNLFTDMSYTLYRKIYETFAAFQIEALLTKDEILCLYLNKIYMGEGRVGAEEASWFYFRRPPEKLTALEAAMIVGLFPSPVRYSPLNNIEMSLKKQSRVLDALERDGWLNPLERPKLLKRFLRRWEIDMQTKTPHAGTVGAYGARRIFRRNIAPTANEYVRQFLYENIAEETIRAGGLSVHTTIDAMRQRVALGAVRERVGRIRRKMAGNRKAKRELLSKAVRRLNGVMVVMDPQTGDIRAVVGGYGVTDGSNLTQRVWHMRRQPGSTIKGFLYAVALDEGALERDAVVVDESIKLDGYAPRNWYKGYRGSMSLAQAVAQSVNTVAVKTLQAVGVDLFRERMAAALELEYHAAAKRFPGKLSLALGSGEVTPMELARIYSILLNGGHTVRSNLITMVRDRRGATLWENYGRRNQGLLVLSEQSCAYVLQLLQGVLGVEPKGTASWIGRKRRRDSEYLAFPAAGKSGTVQSVRAVRKKFPGLRGVHDAWFVGLTPDEVAVVWVGQDEGAPFPGDGSGSAGGIWAAYAQIALSGNVTGEFPVVEVVEPDGEQEVVPDPASLIEGGGEPEPSSEFERELERGVPLSPNS